MMEKETKTTASFQCRQLSVSADGVDRVNRPGSIVSVSACFDVLLCTCHIGCSNHVCCCNYPSYCNCATKANDIIPVICIRLLATILKEFFFQNPQHYKHVHAHEDDVDIASGKLPSEQYRDMR